MQAKTQYHERMRRKQVLYLTIAVGLLSAGLAVAMIVFCYQSAHLRM